MNKSFTINGKYIIILIASILLLSFTSKSQTTNLGLKPMQSHLRNDVIPVTYNSYSAVVNNNKVELSWATNVETSNDHFEVERSFDETNFSTAGLILGALIENKDFYQYGFRDDSKELLKHTIAYYRLKHVDEDGAFTYSVIKTVRINNTLVASKASIQVKPNPYMNKLDINFESDASGKAEINMVNASGDVVKKIESSVTKGNNRLEMQDLYAQTPGMYVINVIVNGKSIDSEKIVKQ